MTMTITWPRTEPIVVTDFDPMAEPMTDDEFFDLCQANPDWRIERTAEGKLILMPPAGGETGIQNSQLNRLLGNWAEADGTGVVFDSSTGFILPNGAKRSPDASWVLRSHWDALTPEQRKKFPPLCPDFVVELRSPTDTLEPLQEKMAEYLANGARLGWLLDPKERKVYVYRPDAEVVCLENPSQLTGDPVLPGFVLDLTRVWPQR
jgi:Uma2 family endonuclease